MQESVVFVLLPARLAHQAPGVYPVTADFNLSAMAAIQYPVDACPSRLLRPAPLVFQGTFSQTATLLAPSIQVAMGPVPVVCAQTAFT